VCVVDVLVWRMVTAEMMFRKLVEVKYNEDLWSVVV